MIGQGFAAVFAAGRYLCRVDIGVTDTGRVLLLFSSSPDIFVIQKVED
jgi:hypothetical protein